MKSWVRGVAPRSSGTRPDAAVGAPDTHPPDFIRGYTTDRPPDSYRRASLGDRSGDPVGSHDRRDGSADLLRLRLAAEIRRQPLAALEQLRHGAADRIG